MQTINWQLHLAGFQLGMFRRCLHTDICWKACYSQLIPKARGLVNEVVFRSAKKYASLWHQWREACHIMDVLSTDNPLDTSDCNTNHLETKILIETNSFADVAGYHARLCFNSYLMNTLRPNPYKENKPSLNKRVCNQRTRKTETYLTCHGYLMFSVVLNPTKQELNKQ